MVELSHETTGDDGSDAQQAYVEYNKTLRAWFIAFGAGGPALLLVEEDLRNALCEANALRHVVILFLIGVAAQVAGAVLNKWVNWGMYYGCVESAAKDRWYCRLASHLHNKAWIDIALDAATIFLFGCAAWLMLMTFSR